MTLELYEDHSAGELHGHLEEYAWTKFPLEVDHMEHMDGAQSLGSRPGLAIPGYFVHVLLSPVVLLLDALDSNHGNSILVLLFAQHPFMFFWSPTTIIDDEPCRKLLRFFPWRPITPVGS